MRWMSDTGPLLHLHQAGLLDLLQEEPRISTTPTVVEEWRSKTGEAALPEWVRTEIPELRTLHKAHDWMRQGLLDHGEAESLAHALATGTEGFLTDDTAAREFAQAKGLVVRGSLGVLLMAAAHRRLANGPARAAWHRLAHCSTLWISPALRRETTEALERILARNAAGE